MAGKWPWPADSKDDRFRRIIEHYRDALAVADSAACLRLDELMVEYGQGWVCDDSIVDVNEMLTAQELADRHGITVWDVYNWERQGRYKGFKTAWKRGKVYRQGDVLAAYANRKS